MHILFILIPIYKTCIPNNYSTYVIPDAQLCIPNFSDKMDGYFFGPCNKSSACDTTLVSCRFSKYRKYYCFSRDGHFCSLQKLNNKSYYQVECG